MKPIITINEIARAEHQRLRTPQHCRFKPIKYGAKIEQVFTDVFHGYYATQQKSFDKANITYATAMGSYQSTINEKREQGQSDMSILSDLQQRNAELREY